MPDTRPPGTAREMKPDLAHPRIALFGNFGAGNLGNEATLRAIIANLRERLPGAEICCICSGPENTASEYDITAAPITARLPTRHLSAELAKRADRAGGQNGSLHGRVARPRRRSGTSEMLRAALRAFSYPLLEGYRSLKTFGALKRCDFLVMPGTGMLSDHALQREIFRWAVIAKACRCGILFVSAGGGPVRNPVNRWLVKTALALADYRSYRDATTRDCLRQIGADVSNDAIYPDLAFSLPIAAAPASQVGGPNGVVIGIGVMNWYGANPSVKDEAIYCDYLARLSMLISRLLEQGYSIRVLIGDTVYDEPVRRDLRAALERRGVTYERVGIVDDPASCVGDLLSQLAKVDVVVSSRFHNLVLAIMLGKPVFAISYHEKFQSLMDGVGLGEFCQDIEHIDIDGLMTKLLALQGVAPEIMARARREAESYRTALEEQYERVCALLKRPARIGRNALQSAPRPSLTCAADALLPSAPGHQGIEPPVHD